VAEHPDGFANEQTLWFDAANKSRIWVVSGVAFYNALAGKTDKGTDYEIEMSVGPPLHAIKGISAHWCATSFIHWGSDEDDNSAWTLSDPQTTVEQVAQGERVHLEGRVRIMGEHATLNNIGYHVVIQETPG